jgi:ketol-acid reductoisomerase
VTLEVRAAMERILADIQSGSFAREWIAESRGGGRRFQALRKAGAEHPIEQVGAKLRAMMPWTEEGKAARDSGPGDQGSSGVTEPRAPRPEPLRA